MWQPIIYHFRIGMRVTMPEFGKAGRIAKLGTGEKQPLDSPKPPSEVYGVQVGEALEWWHYSDIASATR